MVLSLVVNVRVGGVGVHRLLLLVMEMVVVVSGAAAVCN